MWNNRGGRIFNDDISKITNLSDLENMFKILKLGAGREGKKILKLGWKANFRGKICLVLRMFERREAVKVTYPLNIWIGFLF